MSGRCCAFFAAALAATASAGCSGSTHKPEPPPTTPAPTVTAAAQACSAAQGRLVPSHAPFTTEHRLIQPFSYVNLGPPCYETGFPVVRLYDSARRPLNVRQVDGNIVLGTAKVTRNLLQHDDDTSGFNIETPVSGRCVTARYVSASFGRGTTPLATVDYQVCGRVYVTTLFR
jgi:hypothetical protein